MFSVRTSCESNFILNHFTFTFLSYYVICSFLFLLGAWCAEILKCDLLWGCVCYSLKTVKQNLHFFYVFWTFDQNRYQVFVLSFAGVFFLVCFRVWFADLSSLYIWWVVLSCRCCRFHLTHWPLSLTWLTDPVKWGSNHNDVIVWGWLNIWIVNNGLPCRSCSSFKILLSTSF